MYSADKVTSRIDQASAYSSSTFGAPTATAATYMDIARQSLDAANAAVTEINNAELASFRGEVEAAGIGLLSIAEPS